MTKWARLEDDRVAEIIEFDPIGKFEPHLVWEIVPDFVKDHYTFTKDEEGNKTWHEPVYEIPTITAEQLAAVYAEAAKRDEEIAAEAAKLQTQTPAP